MPLSDTPYKGPVNRVSINLWSRMARIEQKLKVEGRRDRELHRETIEQFCRILNNIEPNRKHNSLNSFIWELFQSVSNHFWPESVTQEDIPQEDFGQKRPFVNMTPFRALDTNSVSFKQLVEFIQCNGDPTFHWPRKRDPRTKLKTKMKRERNTDIIPSQPRRKSARLNHVLHHSLASSISGTLVKIQPARGQPTRDISNTYVEPAPCSPLQKPRVSPIQVPTLSFSCRPGWNLNNKTKWKPTSEPKYNAHSSHKTRSSDAPTGNSGCTAFVKPSQTEMKTPRKAPQHHESRI